MTTTEHQTDPAVAVNACPRWCAGKHDDFEDIEDPSLRVHVRPVGAQGIEITAEERDGVTDAARVYLPDFGPTLDVTPEHAALIAQSLLQAVAIIDGAHR